MKVHLPMAEKLITLALIPGELAVPHRLIKAVARIPSKLDLLCSVEPEAAPFDAFRQEYPALHSWRFCGKAMNEEEAAVAVALLRWGLQELSGWMRESDPRFEKLTVVMILLNEFGWSDEHWALLTDKAVNPGLIKLLCGIVRGFRCELSRGGENRASKTNDLISSLVKADNEGDWASITESWQQIETWLHGGLFLEQAVPCLACFDISGLASAMDEVSQIQTAYLVAKSLSEVNRVRLARATSSWRYRFASVLSIAWGGNAFKELGDEARDELAALLAVVSQNTDQWSKWMLAFNKYPIRFPALQPALGKALAEAPEYALAIYVDSISLYAWPLDGPRYGPPSRLDGRQSVAVCLRAFNKAATPELRCRLWRLAYTRWQQWNFGLHSSSEHYLGSIVGSELDYAIAAHAAECLSTSQRDALLASLVAEVNDIEMRWHQSISDLRSSQNSFLSRMQPLLAAGSADCLFESPVRPPEIIQNAYTQKKFGGD